jgi:hypothetical protein
MTYTPISNYPSPGREVGIDEVAGEEVEEVDEETGELYVSRDR